MIKQQLKSMLIYMLASPSSWLSAWTPFQLVLPLSSLFYVQNFYCSLHLLKRAPGDCSVFQPRLWTAALMSVHHRVSLLKRNAKPLSSDKSWAEAETSLQRSITRFTPPAGSAASGWWLVKHCRLDPNKQGFALICPLTSLFPLATIADSWVIVTQSNTWL